ncbi:unnamed protein product [Calypogeia fissa]
MTGSRISVPLLICIFALIVITSPSVAWARFSAVVEGGTELEDIAAGRAGSRGLLQSGTVGDCPYDFSTMDYSTVTSVCKGPSYDASVCCAPFTKLACNYKPQINDFNSLCPIYFMSYLNVAGSYPDGVFVGDGRCNSGNSLCSS